MVNKYWLSFWCMMNASSSVVVWHKTQENTATAIPDNSTGNNLKNSRICLVSLSWMAVWVTMCCFYETAAMAHITKLINPSWSTLCGTKQFHFACLNIVGNFIVLLDWLKKKAWKSAYSPQGRQWYFVIFYLLKCNIFKNTRVQNFNFRGQQRPTGCCQVPWLGNYKLVWHWTVS